VGRVLLVCVTLVAAGWIPVRNHVIGVGAVFWRRAVVS